MEARIVHARALRASSSTRSDLVGDGGKSRRAPQQVLPVIGWARLAGWLGVSAAFTSEATRRACVRARKVLSAPAKQQRTRTKSHAVQRQNADTENYPQLKVL